jgi:hypothetical protein
VVTLSAFEGELRDMDKFPAHLNNTATLVQKRPYQAPHLHIYGTIQDLTQGVANNNNVDNNGQPPGNNKTS